MITFEKKVDPQPVPDKDEKNRFEQIRKAAMERHKKFDAHRTRRPDQRKAENNRLI